MSPCSPVIQLEPELELMQKVVTTVKVKQMWCTVCAKIIGPTGGACDFLFFRKHGFPYSHMFKHACAVFLCKQTRKTKIEQIIPTLLLFPDTRILCSHNDLWPFRMHLLACNERHKMLQSGPQKHWPPNSSLHWLLCSFGPHRRANLKRQALTVCRVLHKLRGLC